MDDYRTEHWYHKYIAWCWNHYNSSIPGFVYGVVLFDKLFIGCIRDAVWVKKVQDRLEHSIKR